MNYYPKTSFFANAVQVCRTAGLVFLALGVFFWLVSGANAQSCIPNSDHRFGAVGWTPDFKWWRNYNEDYTDAHSSYATKMYTVGKLNDGQRYINGRMTAEDWCSDGDVDPRKCFNDRVYPSDQRRIYTNIFEYEKENIRTIISKYGTGGSPYNYNGSTTLHFTIGNEPNWYPYVDPVVYADIYKKYYDYIKGTLNCSKCVIHNGGIFLGNPLDNALVLDFADEAYSAFRWVLGKRSTRVQHYLTWTRRFMARLDVLDARVDIFNVHPYNIEIMEGTSNAEQNMNAFLALIRGGKTRFRYGTLNSLTEGVYWCNDKNELRDSKSKFVLKLENDEPCAWGVKTVKVSNTEYTTSSFPWYYPNPVVWADEFGLLKNNASSAQSISAMNSLVAYFKGKPQVTKWFWYKTNGNDGQIPEVEVKVPWLIFSDAVNSTFALLAPPNVELHSALPATVSNRTSIGNNYRCLQSDNPPLEVTRLSWHDYVAPTFTNIPKWPQSPFNEVLIYPFSSMIVPNMSDWYNSGSAQMHVDGVTLSSSCNVASLERTFTAAEMATIHDESDYFVVESGFGPPLSGDLFTLTIQGSGSTTRTKGVESFGYFGESNPLALNGMAGVIEFKKYLNPGERLKGIKFERGITGNTCGPRSWSFHRVYFARQNPVGIYDAGNFQGIISPNEIYEGGKPQEIPVIKGSCGGCPTDIDAASKAAGFTYSDAERLLKWRPPYSRDGEHTVTFSVVKSGLTYYKSCKLRHIRGKNFPLSAISILLD